MFSAHLKSLIEAKMYSYVGVSVRGRVQCLIDAWTERIAPGHVVKMEDDFHITVKYGIHTRDPLEVQKVLNRSIITAAFGATKVFDNEGADVLIVEVVSSDLRELNAQISNSLEVTDTYDYKPHLTIGFLKKGCGYLYSGDNFLNGLSESWKSVVFSTPNEDVREVLALPSADPVAVDHKGVTEGYFDLDALYEGVDYLAEGGILKRLLLESFGVKEKIRLFYVLSYVYTMYQVRFPDGTSGEKPDDDYVLYSKVTSELAEVVPELMRILKDTYEAWLFNEVVEFGGGEGFFSQMHYADGRKYMFYFVEDGPKTRNPLSSRYRVSSWDRSVVLSEEIRDFVVIIGEPRGGVGVSVGKESVTVSKFLLASFADDLYLVPMGTPSASKEWFQSHTGEEMDKMSVYEEIYGEVNLGTILKWTQAVRRMHNAAGSVVSEKVTKRVISFYKDLILNASRDWKKNIADISLLLNLAHNNGSMSEYIGSKYTLTSGGGVGENFLYNMSNLHRFVPAGDDHKTLRFIYNNWNSFG